jgi:RNA polymerase sigma factor (TIGR02999 family)
MPQPHQITRLLKELEAGDESAFDRLVPLVYDDLKRIARRFTRGQGANLTLNTTGLVHEAYLRLVDRTQVEWAGRDHFLSVYSVVMRNLLVDLARKRKTARHGGELKRITFDDNLFRIDDQAEQLLAVDHSLSRLQALEPRLARVVECRFFAGLTDDETGRALGVASRTVQRDWLKARVLLSEWLDT